MRRKSLFNTVMLLWLWVVTTPAMAILDIEITKAFDGAMPIAVVPFKFVGETIPETDLSKVIRNDLSNSGEFRVNYKSVSHLSEPDPDKLDLDYFKQEGVDSVLIGQVKESGRGSYEVTFHLVDVYQKVARVPVVKALVSKEFLVEEKLLRTLAHHISDQVYEKLTGIRGTFSTQIAYVTTEWSDGKPKRYVLKIADADGYNAKPILTSPEPVMSPSWSPNGRQIAYVSFENKRAEIYISDIVTGRRKKVSAFPGINGAPSWSPDGRKLALVLSHESHPKVYTLDLASNKLTQITHGWSIDTEPRWMPDGKSLVFTSNRGGKPQIYQIRLDSGKIKRLTFEGSYNARASVTPDGLRMALIHRNRNGQFQIAVQDLRNNQLSVLTNTHLDESPSLAPNGQMVIYGTMRHGRRVLAAVSVDGRVKLSLPSTDGDVQEPAWSPFLS